jgi:uncharacterized protein involved in response to NO
MRGAAHLFFTLAIAFAIVGMIMGLSMGISQDHSQYPTHAHIMLAGVSFALFAVLLSSVPRHQRPAPQT